MRPEAVATCPRCGVRRAVKPERGVVGECRDCPPERPWDEPASDDDVAPIRWVRDGLVWRAAFPGVVGKVCENRGGPEGASTPVVPALDQHTSLEGSASRG